MQKTKHSGDLCLTIVDGIAPYSDFGNGKRPSVELNATLVSSATGK